MDTLRVRVYNVLFGDAILVSVPDRDSSGKVKIRHILIDVGNALFETRGGLDEVFEPVTEDILKVLDRQPLDLYVMTHEHMDHVQGLPYAESTFFKDSEGELRKKLKTRYAWLTASAATDYYNKHADANERHMRFRSMYDGIDKYLSALTAFHEPIPTDVQMLWKNNNPRKTADCVKYLQNLTKRTFYVHRKSSLQNAQPFHEARIEIWGPEEDTADYFGKFQPQPMALGVTVSSEGDEERTSLTEVIPPRGVDAGAFYDLVNIRGSVFENLLMINEAKNNTSVVFCLEWRGYRLLFPGDAEDLSWKKMANAKVLKPVHFLKVSHHGSCNGTPEPELLNKILPSKEDDGKPRYAAVSTCREGNYNNVPDKCTLDLIRDRCDTLYETCVGKKPGEHFDVEFEA